MVFIDRLAPPMLLIMVCYILGAGVAHSQHWLHLSSPSPHPVWYSFFWTQTCRSETAEHNRFWSVYLGSSSLQRQGEANFSCFLYTAGKRSQDTSGTILSYSIFQENMKNQKPAVALLQLHFKKRGWKRLFENYTTYPACCKFTRFQLSFKKKFFNGKPFKRQNFVDMDSENP